MRSYFISQRFRRPQFLAGLLLLVFLAQAAWLAHRELSASENPGDPEALRISEGWKQWHGHGIAGAPFDNLAGHVREDPFTRPSDSSDFDAEHSPLLYLLSAAPLLPRSGNFDEQSNSGWRWLPRLPFLACGVFLGASLWYVARRLCGNAGGFIALTFYCFSPTMIQASAVWHTEPEIVAAWGAFGTVFTSIAVAHTLYAPREVVLWNWRRIVLLGVSLAIAIGSQFSLIVLVPIALAFLLYVAPIRRQAGVVICLAACVIGFVLLFGIYFFHPHAFAVSMRHAVFWGATWRAFAVRAVYKHVAAEIGRACSALIFLLPVALVSYVAWPRARYFGNTAGLLVAILFLLLGMAHPHLGGAGFLLAAVPFLFIFVAGVLADLMETQYRMLVTACILGIMAAYVAWSVVSLAQVPRG
jgi:hypothetical protein